MQRGEALHPIKRHSIEWRLIICTQVFLGLFVILLFAQTLCVRLHAATDGLEALVHHVELRGQ